MLTVAEFKQIANKLHNQMIKLKSSQVHIVQYIIEDIKS